MPGRSPRSGKRWWSMSSRMTSSSSASRMSRRPGDEAADIEDVDIGEDPAPIEGDDDTFLEEEEEEGNVSGHSRRQGRRRGGYLTGADGSRDGNPKFRLIAQGAGPNVPRFVPARGHSSVGRALEWHSRGRRFDPAWLHHSLQWLSGPPLLKHSRPSNQLATTITQFRCPYRAVSGADPISELEAFIKDHPEIDDLDYDL